MYLSSEAGRCFSEVAKFWRIGWWTGDRFCKGKTSACRFKGVNSVRILNWFGSPASVHRLFDVQYFTCEYVLGCRRLSNWDVQLRPQTWNTHNLLIDSTLLQIKQWSKIVVSENVWVLLLQALALISKRRMKLVSTNITFSCVQMCKNICNFIG